MNNIRVLIAEDHDEMRCAIVKLLCSKGVEVVGAVSDGEELVHSAACLYPDVIVSDIFMRQMDGLAARNMLIARQQPVPFVFVSALGREAIYLLPRDAEVGLVYKGDLIGHLRNALASVVAGRRYRSPYYQD